MVQSASVVQTVHEPPPAESVQKKPPPTRATQPHVPAEPGQAVAPPQRSPVALLHTEQLPHTLPALQHRPDAQHVLPQTTPPVLQASTAPLQVELATLPHATPLWQQALPHGVVPAGQPQCPVLVSRQATPLVQQQLPQGVVPAAQGAAPADVGPVQSGGAYARKGLRTLAATAAPAAAPNIFSTPRREVDPASCLLICSNRSLTRHPSWTNAPAHRRTSRCCDTPAAPIPNTTAGTFRPRVSREGDGDRPREGGPELSRCRRAAGFPTALHFQVRARRLRARRLTRGEPS